MKLKKYVVHADAGKVAPSRGRGLKLEAYAQAYTKYESPLHGGVD